MTTTQAHCQKLKRLALGERPRLLDLFAGCGGLLLGFEVVGGVEIDPLATRSHERLITK